MSRTRRIAHLATAAARTAARRTRRGPHQPHWSFRYEALLAMLRAGTRRVAPVEVVRARLEAVGDLELRRRRVAWEPVDAGGVPGEWAVPEAASDRVVLYLHGGGYFFGSVHSHRGLIAGLARTGRVRVLGIDYRLAPEHPCPAAVEDVVTAYRWLLDQGVGPERIHFAGDSAGGGLSLAALCALRDAGAPLPRGAALLSPWTDLACTGTTFEAFQDVDYLGTREVLYAVAAHYAGDRDRTDPVVSPLYADLSGLPRLLVLAGGAEILLDDSTRLAERARAAGVDVTLHVEPGEVHVYPAFAGLTPPARSGIARIAGFVRG